MLARRLLAGLVLAAFAVPAPAAQAGTVRARCGYDDAISYGIPENNAYSAVLYGVAAFDDLDSHTQRCYVKVDGWEFASTPAGSGTGVVLTYGEVVYTAAYDSVVELCTEVDGVTVRCVTSVETRIPPEWVIDAFDAAWGVVNDAVAAYVDPVVCPVLASLAPGIPGVVDITAVGDTTVVAYGPVWDCPPYGDLFPPS
jgi:hypothetical protein